MHPTVEFWLDSIGSKDSKVLARQQRHGPLWVPYCQAYKRRSSVKAMGVCGEPVAGEAETWDFVGTFGGDGHL